MMTPTQKVKAIANSNASPSAPLCVEEDEGEKEEERDGFDFDSITALIIEPISKHGTDIGPIAD